MSGELRELQASPHMRSEMPPLCANICEAGFPESLDACWTIASQACPTQSEARATLSWGHTLATLHRKEG